MKPLLLLAFLLPACLHAGQATVGDASSTTRTTRTTRTVTTRAVQPPRGAVVWVQPAPATYHVGDYIDPVTKRAFHESHRVYVREVDGYWARVTVPSRGARAHSPGYVAQREPLLRQELEAELARQRQETRAAEKAAAEFNKALRELGDKLREQTAAAKTAAPAQVEALRAEVQELRAKLAAMDKSPRPIAPPANTESK